MTLLGGMKKTALGVIDKSAFKFKADAAFDSGGIRSATDFTEKEKQPGGNDGQNNQHSNVKLKVVL